MRSAADLRMLALPTFGLALSLSVVTTYAPILLLDVGASPTAIGLVLGGEGAFALALPLLVGGLSDRTPATRFGRRVPYVLAAAPVAAVALVVLPLVHSPGAIAAVLALFFAAYFVYYPPYSALYGDLVPASHHGRAQGSQALMRGLGLGAALLLGGLLLMVWAPLPFVVAAAVLLGATAVLPGLITRSGGAGGPCTDRKGVRALLREHPELRRFAVANTLWELSFAGLKTFIVLFVVEGLGQPVAVATAVIAVVAASYVGAAVWTGRLADRVGIGRVLRGAAALYGAGLVSGAFIPSLVPLLIGLPVVALCGAILLTLPYGLLLGLTPPGSEGAAAGLYGFSRGLGGVLGPLVVGLAIDAFGSLFESTNGYGAMWLAIGVPILLSLRFLPAREREPEQALAGGAA